MGNEIPCNCDIFIDESSLENEQIKNGHFILLFISSINILIMDASIYRRGALAQL